MAMNHFQSKTEKSHGLVPDVPVSSGKAPRGGAIKTAAQEIPVLPSAPSDLAAYGPPVTKQWVANHPMAHVSALPQDIFWRFGLGWDGEFVFSMLEPWEAWFFCKFFSPLTYLVQVAI